MKFLALLSLSVAFATSSTAISAADSNGQPEIVKAEFGLFTVAGGKARFMPTKVVPLYNNQVYGWTMQVRTSKPLIRIKEEVTFPSKAGKPAGNGGRTEITERTVKPENGTIFNTWSVIPGDIKGHYVVRVTLDDGQSKTFEFDIQ